MINSEMKRMVFIKNLNKRIAFLCKSFNYEENTITFRKFDFCSKNIPENKIQKLQST